MIFNYLFIHWIHRHRSYQLPSLMLSILRSSRTLLFFSEHKELCRLDIYQKYVAAIAKDDLFHHLSHRYYLARKLTVSQRVQCVLSHYRFENDYFDSSYKQAAYLQDGFCLWSKTINGINFSIQITTGFRTVAEGDICIALLVNQKNLHRMNFSWVKGEIFKLPSRIFPFIGRNQASGNNNPEIRQQFNTAFPHNAPVYFCYCALQGIAKAAGATEILAVSCENQVGFHPVDTQHFSNTYDVYWTSLGGGKYQDLGYVIPVPFYVKPLAEVSVKHRKRKADRRKQWDEIELSARMVLEAHMLPAPELTAESSHAEMLNDHSVV